MSSPSLPPSPLPHLGARVGPLELANALAACVLSAKLTSKHRQWAARQLVQALAAAGRDSPNRPQTYSDLAGDLRKCPLKRLEGHYNKVMVSFPSVNFSCLLYRSCSCFVFCSGGQLFLEQRAQLDCHMLSGQCGATVEHWPELSGVADHFLLHQQVTYAFY